MMKIDARNELQDFPELVTEDARFSLLRNECEQVIDARRRLPDFVFNKRFANYFALEHGLILSQSFARLLAQLTEIFGDESVNYMTLIPDAVEYYRRNLGFFGLASFTPAGVEERFLSVMWRGKSVDSFAARGGDVAALWGSSLKWAIAADRISWELCVIGVSGNVDVQSISGFRCLSGAQIASYMTSQYHAKDPNDSIAADFNRRFFANYSI